MSDENQDTYIFGAIIDAYVVMEIEANSLEEARVVARNTLHNYENSPVSAEVVDINEVKFAHYEYPIDSDEWIDDSGLESTTHKFKQIAWRIGYLVIGYLVAKAF